MTFTQLFASYWWLLFPLGGMLMGVFAMFSHHLHRSDTIKLIKSYVDQGKDPPQALLDTLRSDEDRVYDYARHDRRGYRGYHRGRWSFVVFAALSAGFGYFGYTEHVAVFNALAIGFGVASIFMAILAITQFFTRPKL